jgi:hypothetical protein
VTAAPAAAASPVVAPLHRLILTNGADGLPPETAGVVHLVLDATWTPGPDRRSDTLALRELVAPILDRADLFELTFQRLDEWAETIGLPDRMLADGVSWWYRRRLGLWLWLVERVHWCAILDDLVERIGVPLELDIGSSEESLAEVAAAYAAARGIRLVAPTSHAAADPTSLERSPSVGRGILQAVADGVRRLRGRRSRRRRAKELGRRDAILADRIATLREMGRQRVLVLTNPAVHQSVAGAGGTRRIDSFLGTVVDRLRSRPLRPVVLALRTDRRDDAVWPTIAADPSMLPDGLLATCWADPLDDEHANAAARGVEQALAGAPARPLDFFGVDFAPRIMAELRGYAMRGLPGRIRVMLRATRMILDLDISALVLINEYGLTEWVAAAHRASVPAVAVQHGIIIPEHVGYRHRRHPGLVLPTRTLVFGPYEARVLLKYGGYLAAEVGVSGAPRLDVDGQEEPSDHGAAAGSPTVERDAIRRRLGVRPGDRMIVLSTTHETVHRRFYWPHVVARLLDGPLPGVHLVFKLHPAEQDDGSYRALVEGLARAGGFSPAPVSIVRDIDLLALLRAADAHLGLYSTVLTDAVTTGTPNLIAATQARRDLLGYVAAGVARPVRDTDELRAALSDLTPPTAAARQAFLDDHFRAGDATGTVTAAIEELITARSAPR